MKGHRSLVTRYLLLATTRIEKGSCVTLEGGNMMEWVLCLSSGDQIPGDIQQLAAIVVVVVCTQRSAVRVL